jgi:hypothetical protein
MKEFFGNFSRRQSNVIHRIYSTRLPVQPYFNISKVLYIPILKLKTHSLYNECYDHLVNNILFVFSGATAKLKWKNLKDSYREKLQKLPPPKLGSKGISLKTKWPYFEMMSFIKACVAPRRSEGNLLENEDSNDDDEEGGT